MVSNSSLSQAAQELLSTLTWIFLKYCDNHYIYVDCEQHKHIKNVYQFFLIVSFTQFIYLF